MRVTDQGQEHGNAGRRLIRRAQSCLPGFCFHQQIICPKGSRGGFSLHNDATRAEHYGSAKEEFADVVVERVEPYLEDDAELKVEIVFLGMFGSRAFAGREQLRREQSEEFVNKLNSQVLAGFPDTMAFAYQQGIFDRMGGTATYRTEYSKSRYGRHAERRARALGLVAEHLPGARARPIPGVDFANRNCGLSRMSGE